MFRQIFITVLIWAAPMASFAGYANFVFGQTYKAGNIVRCTDGNLYIAEFDNPGYKPTVSTYFWDAYVPTVANVISATCTYPKFVDGKQYKAGAAVRYTDGNLYIAKFANPGYDPTVRTSFWNPYSCKGSTVTPTPSTTTTTTTTTLPKPPTPTPTTTTTTLPTPPTPTTAKLLFSDEFDTLNLASPTNPSGTWRPNEGWQDLSLGYSDFAGTSWNINPNTSAFAAFNPFSVSNGILTIKAIRTPSQLNSQIQNQMSQQGISGSVPAWSGGMLVSNSDHLKFKYGYFEFRARFPIRGKGMFPALWFYADEDAPSAKGGGEIDLLEVEGNPSMWTTTVHLKNASSNGPSIDVGSKSLDGVFHTYAIDAQPTYLRFYQDNVLIYQITGSNAAFFDMNRTIRMNYSMDAPWFGSGLKSDSTTPSTLTMEIDYVRVYDHKP